MKKHRFQAAILMAGLAFILTVVPVFARGQQGASSSGSDASAGKLPIRYYMPGSADPDQDAVVKAINDKLAADGVNIDYQPIYVPWDQWSNKINLMLSTGEEFELFHVMEDMTPVSAYVSRNNLTPLNKMLSDDYPALKAHFDSVYWQGFTVNGEIYSVPAVWYNFSQGDVDIRIRKDKYDQYKVPVPQTVDQIYTSLKQLQDAWKAEDGQTRYFYLHQLTSQLNPLHRAYDTWPFYVSTDGLFTIDQKGNARLFYETAEFQQDCSFMNTLYTRGLLDPDILNRPADTIENIKAQGDLLMGFFTGPRFSADLTSQGINGEIYTYMLDPPPEKPILTVLTTQNSNAIPNTTKHPEAALMFLNWLYSSKENQDLLLYGIKGRDWNPVGEDEYQTIKGDDDNPLYMFDTWMIEDIRWHRWDSENKASAEERKNYTENPYPNDTLNSPKIGFSFDPTAVNTEYTNMLAEYTASILPIKLGVLPYEGNFTAASAKMKAAGADKVIAEYQKQLAKHLAEINK
ncbi:MAG: extracellular solute-binding protein [Spirochaetaceae bacterium]|jgi:putative aldouronate transport system substrate-binding protein|nr:extracellular solute-binding protein [Spirochaetaceae bacterium]